MTFPKTFIAALFLLVLAGCANTQTQVVLSFQDACTLADAAKDTAGAWIAASTAAKKPISDSVLNKIHDASHTIAGICQGPLPADINAAIGALTSAGANIQSAANSGGQ